MIEQILLAQSCALHLDNFYRLDPGSDSTKGEKAEDDDDNVAFVGKLPLTCTEEPKSGGRGFHLNTQLARDSAVAEPDGAVASIYQRQVMPVTVRTLSKQKYTARLKT